MTPLLAIIKAIISVGQIASLFAIIYTNKEYRGIVLLIAGILPIIKLFFPNQITALEMGAAVAGLIMFIVGISYLLKCPIA